MWVGKRKCGLTSSALELCGCLKRRWWVLGNAEAEGGRGIGILLYFDRDPDQVMYARARKQLSERKAGRKSR